jgi:hypothetical protein
MPLKVQLIITAAMRTSNPTKSDIMDLINISKEFESVRERYLEWLQSDVRECSFQYIKSKVGGDGILIQLWLFQHYPLSYFFFI